MSNSNRQDRIYLLGSPKRLAKVLIALGLFLPYCPSPRDYGLTASNQDQQQSENIIGTGRER